MTDFISVLQDKIKDLEAKILKMEYDESELLTIVHLQAYDKAMDEFNSRKCSNCKYFDKEDDEIFAWCLTDKPMLLKVSHMTCSLWTKQDV